MGIDQLAFAEIIIVGAGHAGGTTALALRDIGFSGSITLVGAERHLPHERPPFSKDALKGQGWVFVPLADAETFARQQIDLVLGAEVVSGDAGLRSITLSSGRTLTYGALVLATGAVPRRMPGAPHEARHVLRSMDDAMAINRARHRGSKVVIVGGGPIGLEAAAALHGQVAEITVIEAGPRLMARCAPSEFAETLKALHEAHSVRILLSSPVSAMSASADGLSIQLQSGEALPADLVIEGIGVSPETRLAQSLGLAVGNGILVDEAYRTSDPAIFAIGDGACPPQGRQETWSHAESSARAVAQALLSVEPSPAPIPYFWTDQYGSRLQVAGNLDQTNDAGRQGKAALYARDGFIAAAAALDAPRDFAAARRLIGKPASSPSNQRPPMVSVTARQLS